MAYSPRLHSRSDVLRFAGAALALLTLAAAPAAAVEFAVVVSPDVEMTGCTFAELKQFFQLERKFWKAGHPVVVLLPAAGTPTREFMLHRIYKANEKGLKRLMLEKLYRGEIDLAPKTVASDQDALRFAASSENLIAVVPAALVEKSNLRVLRVDGKLPGTAGYPVAE